MTSTLKITELVPETFLSQTCSNSRPSIRQKPLKNFSEGEADNKTSPHISNSIGRSKR
ncbi:hypothetical protein CCHR01_02046 [Colletotrichum chrysophilum]|uniref:Uncharacterized protein n=1 Tax=Colletotrichum chrysophilum TaxID=1836956 RepID=A0AAD9AWG1_9PEZI|nr:hypothetical protein CCHR01_02046 [Colletotrichum chrysophilum]